MRQKLAETAWNEIRTAYAAGIGLRELGRNMGIPEGTVLARAKREGWTQQVQAAKAKAKPKQPKQSGAITPLIAAAITITERGQRHVEEMAGVAEKVVPYVQAMEPEEILSGIEKIEKFDRMARRNYGMDDHLPKIPFININVGPGSTMPPIDITEQQRALP